MLLPAAVAPVTLKNRRPRHDELNLARLNLILSVNRTKVSEWRKELTLDALGTITVECSTDRNDVVPHGIDNDLLLGLISAAVIQNVGPGEEVRITAAELLRLSCLSNSAKNYAAVQRSLLRLQRSTFVIRESWYDQGKHRWRSATFNLVSSYGEEDNATDPDHIGQWKASTILAIRMNPELTKSVQLGYIRPLDNHILEQLKQPMSRSVYRALSLLRTTIEQVDQKPTPTAISLPLAKWAEHLGLTMEASGRARLDLALRSLESAHEDLRESGYLRDVVTEGRGRQKTVTYLFATEEVRPANPEAAQLLARILPERKALELSSQYSPAHVREVLDMLDTLLKGGYKARSKEGLFIDMLRDPTRYRTTTTAAPETAARQVPPPETEPEPARPTRQSFDVFFRMLPDVPKAVKERVWHLYKAGRIRGVDILALGHTDEDGMLRQIASWEQD